MSIFSKSNKNADFDTPQIIRFCLNFFFTVVVHWYSLQIHVFIMGSSEKELIDNLSQLQELRKILDNLDQAIFIYSNKIELANDTFISKF